VVDPKTRLVAVYQPGGKVTRFDSKAVLTDEQVLPGFSVSVAEVFDS
jgi:Uma2 family endonuclease